MPGLEVLRRLRVDKRTRDLPVVVLTVSREDRDILECARLGAENYIIKPVEFEKFTRVTPRLNLRWALVAERPRTCRPRQQRRGEALPGQAV